MFQVVISEANQGKRIPINKNESCLRVKEEDCKYLVQRRRVEDRISRKS